MNFKPTILKIILSLVIGIIIGVLIVNLTSNCPRTEMDTNNNLIAVDCFPIYSIIIFSIISIMIIYLIWSFIERK